MYIFTNPNPANVLVGDCVVRALSILLDSTWDDIFVDLCKFAHDEYDMPSSNAVWSKYLYSNGYTSRMIPDTCPNCYTVRDFCYDNQKGRYLLATGSHVVTVIDGNYYDTWDSGDVVPVYYFKKRRRR